MSNKRHILDRIKNANQVEPKSDVTNLVISLGLILIVLFLVFG